MKTIAEPTRGFESNMAYPQYAEKYCCDGEGIVETVIISTDTWIQLQEYVLKLYNDSPCMANREVRKHWDNILAGIIPFNMRIVKRENRRVKE